MKAGFLSGIVTKDEYVNTLRACQQRYDEMKSEDRDKAEGFYEGRDAVRDRHSDSLGIMGSVIKGILTRDEEGGAAKL